jgi:hypothetical protein
MINSVLYPDKRMGLPQMRKKGEELNRIEFMARDPRIIYPAHYREHKRQKLKT